MFEKLIQFITENYPRARKIVEVGVGHRIEVAEKLKENLPSTEIVVTDIDETLARQHKKSRIRAVADTIIFPQPTNYEQATGQVRAFTDDVMYPYLPIYEQASLIYSVHPPVEIVPALEELSGKVGADLVVVPISDEQEAFSPGKWQKIVRTGRVVGWLLTSKNSRR